jgi:hypothetical protein
LLFVFFSKRSGVAQATFSLGSAFAGRLASGNHSTIRRAAMVARLLRDERRRTERMRLIDRSRARLLGATVGTCLVTAIGISGALAQDATPTLGDTATPPAQTQPQKPDARASAAARTALAEHLQRVTDTIATVQKDRDAVTTGDLAAVDDLLDKATRLRDDAKATLAGDDISAVPQQLFAAQGAAVSAEALLRAQLSDYGLPSQQAGASRTLVAAYNQIKEISDRVSATDDVDAKDFAMTAQSLYKTAYDLYNAGTYAQAASTADVAARVAGLADLMAAPSTVTIPADGKGVVVEPGPGQPGSETRDGEPGERGNRGPSIDVAASFPNQGPGEPGRVVVVGPGSDVGGVSVGGGPIDDFSTDSPLEVPAPSFD